MLAIATARSDEHDHLEDDEARVLVLGPLAAGADVERRRSSGTVDLGRRSGDEPGQLVVVEVDVLDGDRRGDRDDGQLHAADAHRGQADEQPDEDGDGDAGERGERPRQPGTGDGA